MRKIYDGYLIPWPNFVRAGAVMGAVASRHSGPGSVSTLVVICGLSLLVLYSAPKVFFLRVLPFSPLLDSQS